MKNFFLSIVILLTLVSCQSVKDGLTMQKKNNTDEFLIEKKNPLIMPPDYDKLPTPQGSKKLTKESKVNEIETILKKNKTESKINLNKKSSVEKLILEKIESK